MARKQAEPTKAEQTQRTLTENDLKRLSWRSIGPAIMGGRIADMCFQPGNYKAYLVGYASGGLWRTTNLGTTFEPIFDSEITSSVGSVAWCDAPANWPGWDKDTKPEAKEKEGKGKIIWVGTGEGNGRNSSSWGNGVYRSTDGGKKWTCLGLEDSHDIPRLAVHPADPDTCYAACLGHLWGLNDTRGVYKTTDGGKTWDKVLDLGNDCGAIDIMMDPADPNTLYAAMYMRLRTPHSMVSGGPKGGIYKTTDAGKNWTKLGGGLPEETGRIGLSIFAGNSQIVMAVVEATTEGANTIRDDRMKGGGVFRSEDAGKTWKRMSQRSPRAFYFSKIYIDPKDDQRVYMLGWTTEVSDDGGKTFRGGFASLLHADHHAMLINPNDTDHLVIGTDGGASQSFDKGKTWDFLNTIATGQFYNVAYDFSDPYRIIGGLQDNGTWMGPSATNRWSKKDEGDKTPDTSITNADWKVMFWGDGFHAAFDPTNPEIVYAEWQGGHITRINIRTNEKKYLSPQAREGESRHRYNWNTPFFISPHDPTVIYHACQYVFRLDQRGDKWTKLSGDLTTCDPKKMDTVGSNAETYCSIVSLAESPVKKGILWAGSDDGLIHVSQNAGKKWTNVTPKTVDGRYVSRLHPSAFEAGRCLASIDGHRSNDFEPCILITDDFGANWRDITANLPAGRSVKVVREDKFSANVLYAGTEAGLWVSLDLGETWIKMHGKGLPTTPVDDIQQHDRETDLILGTHGRSIWILDKAKWISELTPEVLNEGLHLFTIAPARPKWFSEYSGAWTHKMFRAANPPAGACIDYWVKEFTGDDVKIEIKDSKDVLMKKLSGSAAPGYNRVTWDLQPEEWLKCADEGEEETWVNSFHARPGTYKVTITMGELSQTGELTILPRA